MVMAPAIPLYTLPLKTEAERIVRLIFVAKESARPIKSLTLWIIAISRLRNAVWGTSKNRLATPQTVWLRLPKKVPDVYDDCDMARACLNTRQLWVVWLRMSSISKLKQMKSIRKHFLIVTACTRGNLAFANLAHNNWSDVNRKFNLLLTQHKVSVASIPARRHISCKTSCNIFSIFEHLEKG